MHCFTSVGQGGGQACVTAADVPWKWKAVFREALAVETCQ